MIHYETRVGGGGLLPLPPELSRAFHLKEGDIVDFYVNGDSISIRLIVRNKRLNDLAGYLAGEVDAMTAADIDRAIGDHLEEKHARIDRESQEWAEFEAWKKAGKPLAAE